MLYSRQAVLPTYPRHLVASERELGGGEVERVDVGGPGLQGLDDTVGSGQILIVGIVVDFRTEENVFFPSIPSLNLPHSQ